MARDTREFYLKNEAALKRRLSAFVRALPADLGGLAIRKVAFDVVAETQAAITSGAGGTPRRVDTGRLRAGWSRAASKAKIEGASALPSGPGKSSDGSGSFKSGDGEASVVLRNAVPYAYAIEFGTRLVAPGGHLTRALGVVASRVPRDSSPESIRGRIVEAWKRGR